MKILVLGSGADGGFAPDRPSAVPGRPGARARTQSSLAVSADGDSWILLNASPDIASQIRAQPQLQPRGAADRLPIKAVVLMDAQIAHVAGLLALRGGPRIDLFCTPSVFEELTTDLPLLNVLEHYCGTRWHMLPLVGERTVADFAIAGFPSLRFTAVAVPGQVPLYSTHRREQVTGDNIALRIVDAAGDRGVFYSPGLTDVTARELRWMREADCLLMDGSLGEAQPAPALRPRLLELLQATPARRKVLVRVDPHDPILDEHSAQRRALDGAGIEVAYDGMEITL